jgi:membrane fusion protein (multidrug efflux system)
MKKISLSIIAFCLYFSSCGKEEQQATPQGPTKFAVKNYHGTPRHTEISANIEGAKCGNPTKSERFYTKIYVDEGQTVRKGQILFKLETEMLNQDASASKRMVQAAEVEVNHETCGQKYYQ